MLFKTQSLVGTTYIDIKYNIYFVKFSIILCSYESNLKLN